MAVSLKKNFFAAYLNNHPDPEQDFFCKPGPDPRKMTGSETLEGWPEGDRGINSLPEAHQ